MRYHFPLKIWAGTVLLGVWSGTPLPADSCTCTITTLDSPGTVEFRQADAKVFTPAQVGRRLTKPGDLIKVLRSPSGRILCDGDSATKPLPLTPMVMDVPCSVLHDPVSGKGPGGWLDDRSRMAMPVVGAPVVLSPRRTLVRDSKPKLRWISTAGEDCRLTVRGQNLRWERKAAANAGRVQVLTYDGPEFQPDISYKFIVASGELRSDAHDPGGLTFTLISPASLEQVAREEKLIRTQPVSEVVRAQLLAWMYARYGLNAEAIDSLEANADAAGSPEAQRLLGDLYGLIGLAGFARTAYEAALAKTPASDKFGQAESFTALAAIAELEGNFPKALEFWGRVRDLRTQLGQSELAHRAEMQRIKLGPTSH
jgi:hypothetical protein